MNKKHLTDLQIALYALDYKLLNKKKKAVIHQHLNECSLCNRRYNEVTKKIPTWIEYKKTAKYKEENRVRKSLKKSQALLVNLTFNLLEVVKLIIVFGYNEILLKLNLKSPNVLAKNIKQQRTKKLISENKQPYRISPIPAELIDHYGANPLGDSVVFVCLYPYAKKVQIAGDFNNWQPDKTEMEKVGNCGVWQAQVKIPPGRHRYQIVVDGKWQPDPFNEITEPNSLRGFNSIVEVH